MRKIIMINGKKRSGKDYTAQLLKEELLKQGKSVEIMSFAEPLKQIVASMFEITIEQQEEYKNHPEQFSVSIMNYGDIESVTDFRTLLQRFGSEAMKPVFGNDVWVNLMVDKIRYSKSEVTIIPDFRFKIEYDGIISNLSSNFDIITILVDGKSEPDVDGHSSETGPGINFDFTINNSKKDDSIKKSIKVLAGNLS